MTSLYLSTMFGLKYPEKKRHGAMHTSFCLIKLIAPALLGRYTYLSSSTMFYTTIYTSMYLGLMICTV
jgi:hypothetical protein